VLCQDSIKVKRIKIQTFLSRFISTKWELLFGAATRQKGKVIKIEMTLDGNYMCGRATRSGRDSSGENGDICLFRAVRVPTL